MRAIDPYRFGGGGGDPGPGGAAQNFDGTDDYFELDDWFAADPITGIISIWFRRDTSGSLEYIYGNSSDRVRIVLLATDEMEIKLRDGLGNTKWLTNSGATKITDTNWHHILASWDLNFASVDSWFYLDDVDVKNNSGIAFTSSGIDWTRPTNRVGADAAVTPANFFDGCLSEFYIQVDQFFDLDTVSNRLMFIDVSWNPVDYVSDGIRP